MSATAHLNVEALTLVVGVVLPLVTGVVTKEKAPSWVKALVNGLLSSIAGALIVVIHNGGNTSLADLAVGIATAWGASIVSHYGLWLPTSVTAKVQAATSAFGIGKVQVSQAESAIAKLDPTVATDIEKVSGVPAYVAPATQVTATSTPSTASSVQADASVSTPSLDQVAAEVVAAVAPALASPSPEAAIVAAAPVVEAVAPVAEAAGVPVADVAAIASVAAQAPAIAAEAQVDPRAAAVQGVKDALDALLKAVA